MSDPVNTSTKSSCSVVTVNSGDTLSAIAERCLTSTTDIVAANSYLTQSSPSKSRNASGDLIYPGDKIIIPATLKSYDQIIKKSNAHENCPHADHPEHDVIEDDANRQVGAPWYNEIN